MDEILEKIPELDNRCYIIGGPRQQALTEAMTILLRTTDRCFLSTEFFCLKDSKETIEKIFNETAAASRLGKGAAPPIHDHQERERGSCQHQNLWLL